MKCDDETFIRVDAVLGEANKIDDGKSLYLGNINYYHKPLRYGKWAVTYEVMLFFIFSAIKYLRYSSRINDLFISNMSRNGQRKIIHLMQMAQGTFYHRISLNSLLQSLRNMR